VRGLPSQTKEDKGKLKGKLDSVIDKTEHA
jgi:hypothetical protein